MDKDYERKLAESERLEREINSLFRMVKILEQQREEAIGLGNMARVKELENDISELNNKIGKLYVILHQLDWELSHGIF